MTSTDPKVSGEAFTKLLGSTMVNKPIPEFNDPKLLRSAWDKYSAIPDKYYHPGKFTSFIGFEWTSMPRSAEPAPLRDLRRQRAGDALHRIRVGGSRRPVAIPGRPAQAGTCTS